MLVECVFCAVCRCAAAELQRLLLHNGRSDHLHGDCRNQAAASREGNENVQYAVPNMPWHFVSCVHAHQRQMHAGRGMTQFPRKACPRDRRWPETAACICEAAAPTWACCAALQIRRLIHLHQTAAGRPCFPGSPREAPRCWQQQQQSSSCRGWQRNGTSACCSRLTPIEDCTISYNYADGFGGLLFSLAWQGAHTPPLHP